MNLIVIIAVDHHTSKIRNSSYSKHSVLSWERYCSDNNIELKVITELDSRVTYPVWSKELVFEYGDGYDKIGIVDSDTMVVARPPNIFNMYDTEFCGVPDIIDAVWLRNSIQVYGEQFFPGTHMDIFSYINAGVLFFTRDHLPIFEQLFKFYTDHRQMLDTWNRGGGREQTLLNFHIQIASPERKFLDPSWNTMGIHTRNLLANNWQLKTQLPYLLKYSKIAHFTGFPPEHRASLMESVGKFNTIQLT